MHWSYRSLALSQWCNICIKQNGQKSLQLKARLADSLWQQFLAPSISMSSDQPVHSSSQWPLCHIRVLENTTLNFYGTNDSWNEQHCESGISVQDLAGIAWKSCWCLLKFWKILIFRWWRNGEKFIVLTKSWWYQTEGLAFVSDADCVVLSCGNLPQKLPGLILGLRPANERRRYVTTSLIAWEQTWNQPWVRGFVQKMHSCNNGLA